MSVAIQDLSRNTFPELVLKSERPVVIDFWGPECAPCLVLAPVFHDLAQKHPEFDFFRVEAPRNRMLCVDLKVMSLPTFLCLVNGVELSRLDKNVTRPGLIAWIEEQSIRAKGEFE